MENTEKGNYGTSTSKKNTNGKLETVYETIDDKKDYNNEYSLVNSILLRSGFLDEVGEDIDNYYYLCSKGECDNELIYYYQREEHEKKHKKCCVII